MFVRGRLAHGSLPSLRRLPELEAGRIGCVGGRHNPDDSRSHDRADYPRGSERRYKRCYCNRVELRTHLALPYSDFPRPFVGFGRPSASPTTDGSEAGYCAQNIGVERANDALVV